MKPSQLIRRVLISNHCLREEGKNWLMIIAHLIARRQSYMYVICIFLEKSHLFFFLNGSSHHFCFCLFISLSLINVYSRDIIQMMTTRHTLLSRIICLSKFIKMGINCLRLSPTACEICASLAQRQFFYCFLIGIYWEIIKFMLGGGHTISWNQTHSHQKAPERKRKIFHS